MIMGHSFIVYALAMVIYMTYTTARCIKPDNKSGDNCLKYLILLTLVHLLGYLMYGYYFQ